MKQFFWLVFFVSAVAQPLSKTGIYVLFQANSTYISSSICVQRQVPGSGCQGRCFLNKQLTQDSEREQPINGSKRTLSHIDSMLPAAPLAMGNKEAAGGDEKMHPWSTSGPGNVFHRSIFHPPRSLM